MSDQSTRKPKPTNATRSASAAIKSAPAQAASQPRRSTRAPARSETRAVKPAPAAVNFQDVVDKAPESMIFALGRIYAGLYVICSELRGDRSTQGTTPLPSTAELMETLKSEIATLHGSADKKPFLMQRLEKYLHDFTAKTRLASVSRDIERDQAIIKARIRQMPTSPDGTKLLARTKAALT